MDLALQRLYNQSYKERLMAVGKCITCRKPLDGNSKRYCTECLKKDADRHRAKDEWRKINHICTTDGCGTRLPKNYKYKTCEECRVLLRIKRKQRKGVNYEDLATLHEGDME